MASQQKTVALFYGALDNGNKEDKNRSQKRNQNTSLYAPIQGEATKEHYNRMYGILYTLYCTICHTCTLYNTAGIIGMCICKFYSSTPKSFGGFCCI